MQEHQRCCDCMEEKNEEVKCPHCGWEEGSPPESALHLLPGTIMQNKYIIGRSLGQGGFGITYLAWDLNLNIKLAIKEYLPLELAYRTGGQTEVSIYKTTLADSFNYGLDKFLEEARTLARFSEHPNIVSVKDFFKANGTAYLVMNYIDGVSLSEHLESIEEPLGFEQAFNIFMVVLDALKEVHTTGILHRDLSPDNLLIDTKGRVFLIDFGAARQALGEKNRSVSIIMKTGYSPEEQYRSKGELGPWTDIYSLAATFYKAITGQMPPESIDRLVEDTLVSPSELGVKIGTHHEQVLLKALAVSGSDRFQNVEDFQKALMNEDDNANNYMVDKKEEDIDTSNKEKFVIASDQEVEEETVPASKDSERKSDPAIKMVTLVFVIVIALIIGLGLWLEWSAVHENEESEKQIEESIINLDSDYMIDGDTGDIALGELELGDRVVDPTWKWEFRTASNYAGSGEKRPLVWIVVAKDHYDLLASHVTLLSEELIGRYAFDDSTDRVSEQGDNHWGDSGSTNAAHGLRAWLNSTDHYDGNGFYQAFTDHFKAATIHTLVPNSTRDGNSYNTYDYVFVPSTTELGDAEHQRSFEIGETYPYFENTDDEERVAYLEGDSLWYWTRSPDTYLSSLVRYVYSGGGFYDHYANDGSLCVRPVINLESDTMVSRIPD